ncbi:hypothetical protein ACFOEZ_16975 [Tianweitania populi]|uniref:Uncharacterized protein n=1 Tax=Tianweitania populi TaxID=1607949 RepID=A0A8J3DQ97_9HYPH|nr:hypothetical protein [Tianweitania populi]GHD14859.1 hypothetical protein GCM10016234_20900 [Tianweitania populi]
MSQRTNPDSGLIIRQQQADTSCSNNNVNAAPGALRSRDMHPQTREALAQAVKRASTQLKRR